MFRALVGWSDLAAARSDGSKKANNEATQLVSVSDWRLALKDRVRRRNREDVLQDTSHVD